MATIVTRSGKGSPLTNNEVDANFNNLNTEVGAALPKAGGAMTGAITTNSTFDGRDVATDGTKLDGVEASADVTDTANVTSAGALMDSELTSIASVKALNQGLATGNSPTFVNVTATSLDISGNIDVDGVTNLDVVDIDGAVDMASTLTVAGGATFGGNSRVNGDFSVSAASGEDRFAILPQSAGTGTIIFSGNAGLTAYEPLIIDFETLALRTSGTPRLSIAGNGAATFSSNVAANSITLADNKELILGTGTDFKIFHSNNVNFIKTNSDLPLQFVDAGGSQMMSFTPNGGLVINEVGEDFNFRVESNGNANMLFVDGGTNVVGIGVAPYTTTGDLNLLGNGVTFRNDKAGSNNNWSLIQNTATGGASNLKFTLGTGNILFGHGGQITTNTVAGYHTVFNENGVDADFRVESDNNTHALFVEGSSGNLLVGTNSTDTAATGFRYRSSLNAISSVSDSQPSAYFGRRGSDGAVLIIRKDDATVGSIGTKSSLLTIGTGTTGLIFDSGQIYPWNTTTNAAIDASKDLGASGARFKDLYLSGRAYINNGIKLDGGDGIYFGQDGNSNNKLDDYEEGTWTPVIAGSGGGAYTYTASATARYTKIGNLVTLSAAINNITTNGSGQSGYVQIQGAPFAKSSSTYATGAMELSSGDMSNGQTFATVSFATASATTIMYVRQSGDNSAGADFPVTGINSGSTDFNFTITYQT